MKWTKLPKGCFTGIDWSKPGATTNADPYLVWAETDRFAASGTGAPEWLAVAIELRADCTVAQLNAVPGARDWLRVPPVYAQSGALASLRFCTGRAAARFFKEIAPGGQLHAIVKRAELGMPSPSGGQAWSPAPATDISAEAPPERLKGKVLGLIDDSLALAHANFLDTSGAPRTAWFWRQDAGGGGREPASMGYGHELTAADIAAAMSACRTRGVVDEGAVYTRLGLSTLGQEWKGGRMQFHALDLGASHGTHVLDLFGGPRSLDAREADLPPDFDAPATWARADDAASAAPIVAVQLDSDTVRDTSGGSMNAHVLDGLMYILSRCDESAKVVVNISFGTLAGPHDGSSVLEAAMEQLLSLLGGRLRIVVAAGNSYQQRTHANLAFRMNEPQALHWRIHPDDATPSYLELWIEEGRDQVEIAITPPGREALPALSLGESKMWLDGAESPRCALIYPAKVPTGEHGTCALLAVAPTFSFSADTTTAPSGVWRIALKNREANVAVVDAYIERDDMVIGTRTGARQSRFDDAPDLPCDMQYDMDAFVDDPARTTPIRRSGTFNSIATGAGVVSAGGTLVNDPKAWARYSPVRPDPDATRPQRPKVIRTPAADAASDQGHAQRGVPAAGPRSGATVRLAGTSAAAPQVARDILNRL